MLMSEHVPAAMTSILQPIEKDRGSFGLHISFFFFTVRSLRVFAIPAAHPRVALLQRWSEPQQNRREGRPHTDDAPCVAVNGAVEWSNVSQAHI